MVPAVQKVPTAFMFIMIMKSTVFTADLLHTGTVVCRLLHGNIFTATAKTNASTAVPPTAAWVVNTVP
jgi:hypothetical protein